ncbi:TonB-dependent receptor, partial [Bacteroides thetaiotaomicron]
SDFIDINDIPVEMIDRIEIYKGVVPAKFGGSAVGGAVNIVIKEYPPKYLDVNYSYGSFNTHNASVVSKMNIAPKGIEFGLGGFYTYADNDYKMKSPFQEGLTITRDHDKFKKTVIGGSFKARKWWFDLVEFEPVFIHTYKDIQGIESNIRHAHSHSNAFIFANKMEKENFLLDGLDLDWQLGYIYTDYHFADTASHRTHWDGTHYPAVSEFGGEIGKWASLLTNEKHQLQHKLNLNYLVNENHSVNFNSLLKYAHANPRDGMKDKVIGYRTDFPSNMFSWVAGLNYDYRTSNDKFLNSFNVKYYYYSMKTRMASVLVKTAEDIDTHKNDFGISNALRYRITPSLMAKASFGYDVRLPSEEELLGDGYVIAPAGNLTPERNISVNIGMLFDLTGKASSNLQIELNGYYMHLKDMIRFTGGFLQSQYQNFGEMRTLGMEAEVKADMTRWLYGYVNATYQDLRDVRKYEQNTTVANPTKGSRMPNIPYLMANAGLEFHKENLFGGSGMNTRIFTDASFVEEYLYDFEQSQFQQHRIPRALSCNIGFEQSFGNGRYFIMGKINNLTDTKMISEFNRPLPGRSFTIRFRYVFK